MLVALIDDHQMIAEAIRNSLLFQRIAAEIEIYGSAQSFFEKTDKSRLPELIITDLLMPGINGVELLKAYHKFILSNNEEHTCKLIVLSTLSDPLTVKMAIRYGANAYLSKESTIEELIEAINECMDGNKYIGRNLRDGIVNNFFNDEQIVYHLSPREKDVLKLICSGKTIKEAAYDMNLSPHTVKSYYKNIMKKFNVNRTSDLIVFAMKNGFYQS
ncbi:response regulator transcription factor [Chryseobacterium oncorhynchi]|uniref:DNA-binding response regulator n=1 Tax=Chryseobacterium oncorhynchi TaxID=741074 RepID=A0A316WLK2_9FLAO|nr:response regulator transcription factor [Chryseobacterium oncorhynchi]PWN60058.1 DNA-binding response regulator [Chryseobacterium oncorhynchi]